MHEHRIPLSLPDHGSDAYGSRYRGLRERKVRPYFSISFRSELQAGEEYNNQGVNHVAIVRSCLHSTLNPLLNTIRRSDKSDSSESSLFKRVTDLDMALVHYEQNLNIPEVHLNFPSFLVEAGDKCRAAGRVLTSAELGWGEKPSPDLLNRLLHLKGKWMSDLRKLMEHTRDPNEGTTLQEINYWNVLRGALEQVATTLQSYEVQVLFAVVRQNNLVSGNSLEMEKAMEARLKNVAENAELLNGVPINALLTSTSLTAVHEAIVPIFPQLKKIRNCPGYPVVRIVGLVNLITKDVLNQCLSILSGQRLMDLPFEQFTQTVMEVYEVCKTWDAEKTSMWHFLRELNTRRNEKCSTHFKDSLAPLKVQMNTVESFRNAHQRYLEGLEKVAAAHEQERKLLHDLESAYSRFCEFNVSDLSQGAHEEWKALTKAYDANIEMVDQSLVNSLSAQLEGSRSTHQTFKLFGEYNVLFFRPCIQSRNSQAS